MKKIEQPLCLADCGIVYSLLFRIVNAESKSKAAKIKASTLGQNLKAIEKA